MDSLVPPHESNRLADHGEVMFSIVMPVYNGAASLAETCGFLTMQTATEFEVIMVNDGSTDNTAAVAKELLVDQRFQLVNTENGGVCRARNIGAHHANGDYLLFLDCDDVVTCSWLSDFKQALTTTPADIVFCGVSYDFKEITHNNQAIFLAGTFCVKKSFFFGAGEYDEQLKFSENTELGWRVMDLKPVVAFVPNNNFTYRRNGRNAMSYLQNRVKAFYHIAEKHKSRFKKEPKLGRLYYQVAAVDNIRLGNFREGRKLMWQGYWLQPSAFIGLIRAVITCNKWLMKKVWKKPTADKNSNSSNSN